MGFKTFIDSDDIQQAKALLRKKYVEESTMVYLIENGSIDMIQAFSESGAKVAKYLWVACQEQRETVVDYLLTIGANPDHEACLSIVCENGNEVIFGKLLDADVTINRDYGFYHPLLMAASNGHYSIVCKLFDEGIKMDYQDPDGNNALHLACKEEDFDMVCLLRSLRVPVVPNECGNYPFELTQDSDIITIFA